ncbi:ANTAR domain-containing protein [Streptomyces sp. NPDC048419]|uniref:ANTAR domain-containing protein n=1 Tax=Streptomyces sp. NPDC048419 TaxID=3365547 RepID=UPI00371AFCF0
MRSLQHRIQRRRPANAFRGCERNHQAADTGRAGPSPDPTTELLRENEQLRRAMESRPVIDMARGVLMVGCACRPEEAWEILATVSQHANVKLRHVAEAVTAAATGNPMPASCRNAWR